MSANDFFLYLIAGAACLAYVFSMAYQKRAHGRADKRIAFRFAQGLILTVIVLLLISAAFHLTRSSGAPPGH